MRCRVSVLAAVGIVVASSHLSALQVVPQLTLVEDLRVVSNESSREMSLTRVTGLVVFPDGGFLTAHSSESLMRVFDANGKFVRAFGRAGDGPGEFGQIGRIGTIGDSLWVDDGSQRRYSVFTREGRLVRSVPYPQRIAPAGAPRGDPRPPTSSILMVGFLQNGRDLALETFRRASTSARTLPPADSGIHLVRDSAGAIIARVLKVHLDEKPQIHYQHGNFGSGYGQRLDASVTGVVAPGGARFVILQDAPLFGGQPGQVRLTESGSDGRVVTRTLSLPPLRVSRNYADSIAKAYVEARSTRPLAGPPGARPIPTPPGFNEGLEKAIREQVYVPDFYPVGGTALLGRDGALWINYPAGGALWSVIADGMVLSNVRVPEGVWLRSVSRDVAWGTTEDDNGLPIIRRYRVTRER